MYYWTPKIALKTSYAKMALFQTKEMWTSFNIFLSQNLHAFIIEDWDVQTLSHIKNQFNSLKRIKFKYWQTKARLTMFGS